MYNNAITNTLLCKYYRWVASGTNYMTGLSDLLYAEANHLNHAGPCGPIALSVLTGQSYLDSLAVLEDTGADHDPMKGGVWASDMFQALRHLGYEVIDRTFDARQKGGKTISSVSWMMRDGHFNQGLFLIQTRTHMAGVRDGIIHDWANSRKMHITGFYEVRVIEEE